MAHRLYTLVETELYTWMLSRLAPIREIDDILVDLTWALARLADDLPFVEGSRQIRHISSKPLLQDDGTVVRLVIAYYAMITHTDAQVGRILDSLEKTGKRKNTIIVFASDNGLAVGRHGLMGKQNVYEHSVRVPMIVRGPGIPEGQTRDQLCYLYDIYPTLCAQAGLPTPDTVAFQSLAPVIQDDGAQHREHLYFAFMAWQRSVRNDRFKLIEYCVDGQRHTQLFDLRDDPQELNNLADHAKQEDILHRLRQLLQQERLRLNDGDTPFPFTDKHGKEFWSTFESS